MSDLLKTTVFSLSYLGVVSSFFTDMKIRRSLSFFIIMFTMDALFTYYGWEVYANYIYLAVATAFIGGEYSFLKSLNFSITIFAVFQWVVIFVGSIGFILFPYEAITENILFVMVLSFAHLGTSVLLIKYQHSLFKVDVGNKLLLIDGGAKLFFILFFNLFFPRYFEILGMEHYAVVSLVLLSMTVIFIVYRGYSISLERQNTVNNHKIQIVIRWAEHINALHKDFANSDQIKAIENPVVQALLHELTNTSEKLGIKLNMSVDFVQNINLNNYDLFNILGEFIESALHEVKSQIEKTIYVEVGSNAGCFRFMIQTNTHSKPEIVINQLKHNSNVTVSSYKSDSFVQILEVV